MVYSIIVSMLLSLLPIIELRGGIPFAIAQGIDPITAFIFCALANILVAPIVFFFLDKLHKSFLHLNFYKNTFNSFLKKTRKRKDKVEKDYHTYGLLALTFFVAIPLPVTGAWTGTFIAWLLNLKRFESFLAISLGVIIAGIIITLAASGIITLFRPLI